MGLLNMIAPYSSATTGYGPNRPEQNSFTNWVNNNPYTMQGIGSLLSTVGLGLASGDDPRSKVTGINQALAAQQGPLGQLALNQKTYDAQQQEVAKQQQQQNLTVQTLIRAGRQDLADSIKMGAATPGEAWSTYVADAAQKRKADADLNTARGAAGLIKDPDLRSAVESGAISINDALKLQSDAAKAAAGGAGDWGSTVMLGRDKNGNAVPLRAAPGGGLSIAATPDGITFDPGGMAGARESATVDAKTAAQARQALPGAEQAVGVALQAIDEIRNNSAGMADQFGSTLGVPNRWMPARPGSERGNLIPALEQVQGQGFLQARQMLKGGGAITDWEGQKAEMAYSRMQSAIANGDEQSFLDALTDFEDAVVTGYQKLQAAAQGSYSSPDNYGGFSGSSYVGGNGAGSSDLGSMKQRYGLE